ncbi:hypothetical protein [Uliginosibacterium gangwonense]|uniref:hypothetical protein n=1 Tax=Uliginosibacterium gangwonense TaxID=392736 RepID=UPI00036E585D|nr:hypothetical protein [Uliginosibacterium gangwonense]
MMRRETAYRMAGRNHHHEDILDDALRRQEIRFSVLPPGQAERAVELLSRIPGLGVAQTHTGCGVRISYDLAHHTLRGVEAYLEGQGFHLDASLFSKLKRALVYYCEDTQCRNAKAPQRLIKQSDQVYIKAYEHHPHGDHDDTPLELREIK